MVVEIKRESGMRNGFNPIHPQSHFFSPLASLGLDHVASSLFPYGLCFELYLSFMSKFRPLKFQRLRCTFRVELIGSLFDKVLGP